MRVVVALICALFQLAAAQLSWPDQYHATGFVYLPYGDISEPFEGWVDMTGGKSRLDTYGGKQISVILFIYLFLLHPLMHCPAVCRCVEGD